MKRFLRQYRKNLKLGLLNRRLRDMIMSNIIATTHHKRMHDPYKYANELIVRLKRATKQELQSSLSCS